MKYIILAAGVNKRLQDSSKNLPKCLMEVGGKPIIEHIFNTIDPKNEVQKIIVVGTEGNCWNDNVHERFSSYQCEIVYNPKNIELDNSYSLYLALRKVDKEPVIIIDGDLIFDEEILTLLINSKYENALLSRRMLSDDEKGGIIKIDVSGKIIEVGETLSTGYFTYLYAGIAKIEQHLAKYLLKHLEEHAKIVDAFNNACAEFEIYNVPFNTKKKWININTMGKLTEANKLYEKN